MAILSTINFVVSNNTKTRSRKHARYLAQKFDLAEKDLVEIPAFYCELQMYLSTLL